MHLDEKKYYKRYQFEAVAIEEREVSEAYRRRLTNYSDLDAYVRKVITVTEPLDFHGSDNHPLTLFERQFTDCLHYNPCSTFPT